MSVNCYVQTVDLVEIKDVNLAVTFILMFGDLYRDYIPDF